MDELKRVTRVKESAEHELLQMEGVTGVGVGYKVTRGERTSIPAIVVFVRHKEPQPRQPIPPEIDGVPTDVQERAFDLHQADSLNRGPEGADGGPAGRSQEGEGRAG